MRPFSSFLLAGLCALSSAFGEPVLSSPGDVRLLLRSAQEASLPASVAVTQDVGSVCFEPADEESARWLDSLRASSPSNALPVLIFEEPATLDVVATNLESGGASADETSAKTRATLLELGLLPDLVLTNETELASSPIPITVNTNDCELTLFNYSALRGTTDPERPDMFKIVFKPGDAPALLLGTGFVHHGTTNCLVEMAAPLAVTPMPIHMLKEYWVHMPEVDGVCLRGTPTNTSPTRVFLARRGAVCILQNSTISNLVDLARTVCDVLSPQSGMPESNND